MASEPYNSVPVDAPPIDVDISLRFRMSRAWQDAAAFLRLPLEEYARRRLLMTAPILFRQEGGAAYEAVYLNVEKQK